MKRIILIGLVVLVVVIGGGVYWFLSSLDGIVKAAVEQVGSEVTGTQVTLGDVEISLTDGRGSLRNFRMTNPKGFAEGDAFKFDEVRVTIDVASVTGDPVIIKEVLIQGPDISYALLDDGKSNLNEIKKNADQYGGSGGGSGNGAAGGGEGPKIVIENLYLRDGKVGVSAPGLIDETLSAPLPDIHLTDIGKEGNGATPAEIAQQTIDAIVASADKAVGSLDVEALIKGAGAIMGGAGEEAGKAAEEAGKAAGEAGKAVEEVGEGATDALKKLLE